MVVIKVVRRVAELSESKGLNQDQKHLDFLFERPYERLGIVRCLSVHRPDESSSSPLVSTGRLGDDPFRSLGSPEVGLSEVPLAKGWVTCKSASSAGRKLLGPG
jgi:hypothetical protein